MNTSKLIKTLLCTIIFMVVLGVVQALLNIWIPNIFNDPVFVKIFATEWVVWVWLVIVLAILHNLQKK